MSGKASKNTTMAHAGHEAGRSSAASRTRASARKQDSILGLQHSAGNQAVGRMLHASSGRPLEAQTREQMESRFGEDFSRVRVHSGAAAEQSAQELSAAAYTAGEHLVLGPGNTNMQSEQGRELLAHELAHVVQQRRAGNKYSTDIGVPRDRFEKEADGAAEAVLSGKRAAIAPSGFPPAVQTKPLPGSLAEMIPSTEVPDLSEATVTVAKRHLNDGEWQEAIDVIFDELVRTHRVNPGLFKRPQYDPALGGEGETERLGYRRKAGGGREAIRPALHLGKKTFTNVPWLYSTMLHEYQHVLQTHGEKGLPTIETIVPGQPPTVAPGHVNVGIEQQDVDSYATEILNAAQTGVAKHPKQVKVLWGRLHTSWMRLGAAERRPVKDLYTRAHLAGEAILGVGSLTEYKPLP